MIVTVASGKGGTGKTTVAVNLALSLEGAVQLLDCDVDEPNVHTLLPVKLDGAEPVMVMTPQFDEERCTRCRRCSDFCPNHAIFVSEKGVTFFPELCYSCGGCLLVCPSQAISEGYRQIGLIRRGATPQGLEIISGELTIGEPLVVPVIKSVKGAARPSKAAIIVDCPPGVACPMVESVHGSDFCLLVTEPTPFGLHDLRLAVEVVRQLGIPMGVVVNRAGLGNRRVYDYCREEGIPILMEIPDSREIAQLFSEGIPFVERMPEWKSRFRELFQEIERRVSGE